MFITNYQAPIRTKISSNIAHQRPRDNPTNSHTRIFLFSAQKQPQIKIKCTPTFHSNIFYHDDSEKIVQNSCNHSNHNKTVAYLNRTKEDRQISLNRNMKAQNKIGRGTSQFDDNQKLQLLRQLKKDRKYDRQRKLLELSSNPITDLSNIGQFSYEKSKIKAIK